MKLRRVGRIAGVVAAAGLVVLFSLDRGAVPGASAATGDPARTACLQPRQPQTRPARGWLRSLNHPLSIEMGASRTPGQATKNTATAFARAVGHGFTVSSISESGTATCPKYRFARLQDTAGNFAILEVAQLRDPIDTHTLPVGESGQFRKTDDGSDLYVSDFDGDGCRRSAINVSSDGLLVRVTVANKNSVSTAGWPTTLYSPSTGPHAPAPLTLYQVKTVAQTMLKRALTA